MIADVAAGLVALVVALCLALLLLAVAVPFAYRLYCFLMPD